MSMDLERSSGGLGFSQGQSPSRDRGLLAQPPIVVPTSGGGRRPGKRERRAEYIYELVV